jgi:hypothetical protein
MGRILVFNTMRPYMKTLPVYNFAVGSQTLNSNNSHKFEDKKENIVGFKSGAQVGPFGEKNRPINFALLSLLLRL